MFTVCSNRSGVGQKKRYLHEREPVAGRVAPHADVRRAVRAAVLVARDFRHPPSLPERLDRHLLLDGRRVLAQVQLPQHGGPHRAEAVLAVAQLAAEPPVDAGGDERAAGQPQELVEAAVQLARSAAQTRRGDVVGPSARIGSTSSGMSSGSCEPSASRNTVTGVRMCGNRAANRLAFAAAAVGQHGRAALRGDRRRCRRWIARPPRRSRSRSGGSGR